jgi:hypothetical protein
MDAKLTIVLKAHLYTPSVSRTGVMQARVYRPSVPAKMMVAQLSSHLSDGDHRDGIAFVSWIESIEIMSAFNC